MRSLILDLDYTILDTVAFEQALARSLNLSWSQWQQAYTAYMRDQIIFEPQAFLRGRTTLERKQFLTICDATWKYLYPDVRPFLRQAQAKDYTITVLTYGQKAWQRRKGVQAFRSRDSCLECRQTQ